MVVKKHRENSGWCPVILIVGWELLKHEYIYTYILWGYSSCHSSTWRVHQMAGDRLGPRSLRSFCNCRLTWSVDAVDWSSSVDLSSASCWTQCDMHRWILRPEEVSPSAMRHPSSSLHSLSAELNPVIKLHLDIKADNSRYAQPDRNDS